MQNDEIILSDNKCRSIQLPDNFLFTQNSLNTFESCPLKFKKRYIDGLRWKSLCDEVAAKRLKRGMDFHLLARRYFMGIDHGLDQFTEEYPELGIWVENLEREFKISSGYTYLPEYRLAINNANIRLEANFDLLIVGNDSIEIWDWKTHEKQNDNRILPSDDFTCENKNSSRHRSEKTKLENSMQTIVYMFVLKEQLQLVTGKPYHGEKIVMYYWQPDPPQVVAEIIYTDQMHEKFRLQLNKKINDILEYDYNNFDKTFFKKQCKYCEFNWMCNNERINFVNLE